MGGPDRQIRIIDETLREGMQFHGLVFSLEQRIKILEFQEMLGVDICQAGYPSALDREAEIVRQTAAHARVNNMNIRTAALGRALRQDAETLVDTCVDDPHFHFHLKKGTGRPGVDRALEELCDLFARVKAQRPDARISLAMLDIGRTDPDLLSRCVETLDQCPHLAILSLPDTSGIMVPDQIRDRITRLAGKVKRLRLAVHCHNDYGMASANTLTGILAGAAVMEASVLGIGERNGIADLYITAKRLRSQGIKTGMDLDNIDGFRAYYTYVNSIVTEQTGLDLMDYRCPVFGAGVKTHVAGTHAGGRFGTAREELFHLNPLCGRQLVKKYLDRNSIPYQSGMLEKITETVKSGSMDAGRRLNRDDVLRIISGLGE